MSEQILLQGKLLGIDEFLIHEPKVNLGGAVADERLVARSLWFTLLSEVLPRALLAKLELAKLLLGSSGGGQFLVILPGTVREAAEVFLQTAARQIAALTSNRVKLLWGITENLGDWTVVRKRLTDELQSKLNAPLAAAQSFEPFVESASTDAPDVFTPELARALREASHVGWAPGLPAIITADLGEAKHSWPISANLSADGISIARHAAPGEGARPSAYTRELGHRAQGRRLWGVLRGDVDHFAIRLRRVTSIEEHVQASMLYKQFFAGELELLCSLPDAWRRVTVLYSGGNDFAVYGSWDALLNLARELQRVFQRFTEENLKEYPGAEAKTITMAVAFAAHSRDPLAGVYEECGRNLALAKAADKDCIYLLDRILEWKQLTDAADLKEAVARIGEEFRAGRQFLQELTVLYQKVSASLDWQSDHEKLLRRAYRFQRRYNRVASSGRDREFQKLRTHLINEIVGRNVKPAPGKYLKLRPAGVVALEWARLAQEV